MKKKYGTKIGELAAEAVESSMWATPSVRDQPSITLVRWSVVETQTGERYFVGHNLAGPEGRVSTSIRSFDPSSLTGITHSGRIYRLVGPPGHDTDGYWVWSRWAGCQKLQWREVTSEFNKPFLEPRI